MIMKTNYQTELEKIIQQIPAGEVPTLLLHSCCGPCSTYVLEYLAKYFEITVYFYNPNIMPKEEYLLRLQTQKAVLEGMNFPHTVHLAEGPYEIQQFLTQVKGLEDEPERGKRCDICMDMRIKESARYAAQHHFDYFCTALSVSPHKNAILLNDLSSQYATEFSIPALPADFKKKNGYLTSIRLSKELGLYRQNYCGCIFSKQQSEG